MAELIEVRMRTNLFRASRMNGVVVPDAGEIVALDEDSAKRFVDGKYAEYVEEVDAEVAEVAAVEAPETATEKRGPGRPRKAAE